MVKPLQDFSTHVHDLLSIHLQIHYIKRPAYKARKFSYFNSHH